MGGGRPRPAYHLPANYFFTFMYYNQIISTTTDYAFDDSVIGYSVTEKTLPVLDLFVLVSLPVVFFLLIAFFTKRRK